MATTIKGMVFNDLNHNGMPNPGEPGIPNVFITLFRVSNGACTQTQTGAGGVYSFTVHAGGVYRIYETVVLANACPPTLFIQPAGFTMSNCPRVRTVTVDNDDGDGQGEDSVIDHQDFSHDTLDDPLPCTPNLVQFVNTPTQWFDIDAVTGVSTLRGLLTPDGDVNAIGFNVLDGFLYGCDQTTRHVVRIDDGRTLFQLVPNPPGLPANDFNVGSFDLDGHLFIMVNDTARFYTVDLKPNSPTFLKLVDPTNNFAEQTASFGTPLSAVLNVSDWGFSPTDGFLYGVRSVGSTGQVMRVNPETGTVTGLATGLTVLDPPGRSWGAAAVDADGRLFAIYNGDGGVFRFIITGNTASGTRISTTFPTSFNDAAMCPAAAVGPIADMSVIKHASPAPVVPGTALTYTITVTNAGPDAAPGVTLSDAVPPELSDPEFSVDGDNFLPWPGEIALGTFPPGRTVTVTLRGTVSPDASGEISNTAIVTSQASDPTPGNNTSTVVVPTAAAVANMAVFKEADPDPVSPGGVLLYTITVINQGPSDALNVQLTDVAPPELLAPAFSLNGDNFLPWPGQISLGTVSPGEVSVIRIRGTVSPGAVGDITNTAAVSSTTADPVPGNNTATVIVEVINQACDARCQAITDLIGSASLMEAGFAHILNAEGEKLQKIIGAAGVSPQLLLEANRSVQSLTGAIALLDTVLMGKLSLFGDCLCNPIA